jgi:hypothetical protein
MVYDHRFGEGILVFMDNQAYAQLSDSERTAYLQKMIQAVQGGQPVITPETRSLPALNTRSLLPDR